jgi:hypothetical protein
MILDDDFSGIVDILCEEGFRKKTIDRSRDGEPSRDIGWQ